MELKDVVSVTGMPGLHKIIGKNKSGLILESLTDQKKFGTNPRQRISILSDVAMFTEDEEVKLAKVLMNIKSLEDSGKTIPSVKADNEEVKSFMTLALPNYDRERVYTSDMKKLFVWYTTLKATDLDWSDLEKEESLEDSNDADSTKKAVNSLDSKGKKSLSNPKNTAVRKTASGTKTKTTTPRKMGS